VDDVLSRRQQPLDDVGRVLCDGTLTAAQIADLVAQTFDLAAPPEARK